MEGNPDIDVDISKCTIFMTMRPWKFDCLSPNVNNQDRVIEVCGLDHRGMKTVIEKVLENYFEMDNSSKEFAKTVNGLLTKAENVKLGSLMEIPLLLTTSIHHWQSNSSIEESMTGFFAALVNLLIQIAFDNEILTSKMKSMCLEQAMTTGYFPVLLRKHKKLKKYFDILLSLGKVAYQDLVIGIIKQIKTKDKSLQLVFDRDDLEDELGKAVLTFALEVGLLSQTYAPGTFDDENVSINFFHKTVEEFLAAIYISCGNEVRLESFLQAISSLESVVELSNILIFCIGIKPTMGHALSRYVAEMADSDVEIMRYRRTGDLGDTLVGSVFYTLRECYREMTSSLSLDSNAEYREDMYHIPDVLMHSFFDSKAENKVTYEIIRKYSKHIMSLFIDTSFFVDHRVIPDTVISKCLNTLTSLKLLHINGVCSFNRIDPLFSSLSILSLTNAAIPDHCVCAFQTALHSNNNLLVLKLNNIRICETYICLNLENSKQLQILEIENNPEINMMNVQLIDMTKCTQLTTLVLRYIHVPSVSMLQSALFSFTQLKKLELSAIYCLDKLCLNVSRCKLLSELCLSDLLIGDIQINPDSLNDLTVDNIIGSLRGLLHILPKCRHLTELWIGGLNNENSITASIGWQHVMRYVNKPVFNYRLLHLPMSFHYIKPFLLAFVDGFQNATLLAEILPLLTGLQRITFSGKYYSASDCRASEKRKLKNIRGFGYTGDLSDVRENKGTEHNGTDGNVVKDIKPEDMEYTEYSIDDLMETVETAEDSFSDEANYDHLIYSCYLDEDMENDSDDVMLTQLVGRMTYIRTLDLFRLDMGEKPLLLVPGMDRLERVRVLIVIMSADSWNKFITSLLSVPHEFEIDLVSTNIDDDSVSIVQSSPEFKVTELTVKRGEIYHEWQSKYTSFCFSRLAPKLQDDGKVSNA